MHEHYVGKIATRNVPTLCFSERFEENLTGEARHCRDTATLWPNSDAWRRDKIRGAVSSSRRDSCTCHQFFGNTCLEQGATIESGGSYADVVVEQ